MMPDSIAQDIREQLLALGFDEATIDTFTPKLASELIASRTQLKLTVSKFRGLGKPDVADHFEITWNEWIDELCKPPPPFAGKFEHPGWSPVVFDPATRSKENAVRAFGLVIDHDENGDWSKIQQLWCDAYGVMHATKSHGAADRPGDSLRVVLPLSRPVNAEEYGHLWDWAAARTATIGCPIDSNAKDISRFWYDPAQPPAGYITERLHGRPLNPDAILSTIERPKLRVVQPPAQLSDDERIKRARAYLAKIPGAVSGNGGHTTTFNAVAHVMIGFDLTAADALHIIATDYNPRCEPPWNERALDHKIESVSKHCKRPRGYLLADRPRIETTRHAAAYTPPTDLDVDWQSQLLVNKERNPRKEFHNTLIFVRHHPEYCGKWSMDMRTETPWFDGAPVKASLVSDIRAIAGRRLGYTPAEADVHAAIVKAAEDRPFHPIQQYLRSLDWDGVPRLDDMANRYLGSPSPLHAEMVRKFMIGAAARVLMPGCKLDTALMLTGAQGLRKSTFFAVLGGEWHADSFIDITNKDSFLQLHSAWIYEFSELENVMGMAKESRLKAWMTSTHDLYRAPYQKVAARRARAVVICGTTNKRQFLTDDTGSRRFWIVPVERTISTELLAAVRDQLWAEAVCCVESGERWWFDADSEAIRETANREFEEEDSWTEPVAAFLASPHRTETTTTEILVEALKLEIARHDRAAQTRAGRIAQRLGWVRQRLRRGEARIYVYHRPDLTAENECGEDDQSGQE